MTRFPLLMDDPSHVLPKAVMIQAAWRGHSARITGFHVTQQCVLFRGAFVSGPLIADMRACETPVDRRHETPESPHSLGKMMRRSMVTGGAFKGGTIAGETPSVGRQVSQGIAHTPGKLMMTYVI